MWPTRRPLPLSSMRAWLSSRDMGRGEMGRSIVFVRGVSGAVCVCEAEVTFQRDKYTRSSQEVPLKRVKRRQIRLLPIHILHTPAQLLARELLQRAL